VTLKESENASIHLKLERAADGALSSPNPEPAPAPDAEPSGKRSPLVFLGFGVGAAGIAVGAITGILALSKASSAKGFCVDSKCQPAAQDSIDASNTFANVSNVGFGVGIVGVGVGVIGLLMPRGKTEPKPPATATLRVRPMLGLDSVGLRGVF
jgi:hypothetical protein